MSQSPDVCEIGRGSSQLCFRVLYLFLGFKDFRCTVISCFPAFLLRLTKVSRYLFKRKTFPVTSHFQNLELKKKMFQGF